MPWGTFYRFLSHLVRIYREKIQNQSKKRWSKTFWLTVSRKYQFSWVDTWSGRLLTYGIRIFQIFQYQFQLQTGFSWKKRVTWGSWSIKNNKWLSSKFEINPNIFRTFIAQNSFEDTSRSTKKIIIMQRNYNFWTVVIYFSFPDWSSNIPTFQFPPHTGKDATVHPIQPIQTPDDTTFDITVKLELGDMASLFFNRAGVILYYVSICIYLYGSAAVYGAIIGKNIFLSMGSFCQKC